MASEQGGRGEEGVDRGESDLGISARQPGHELAEARARRGTDRAEMAARLHLPERQLHALECDDYQQLPPPAFVRGYLRAYAREVDLDGDDIVGAFDALSGAVADPEIRPLEKSSRASSSRASLVSLVVLIGVVAAGFGVWLWQAQQGGGEPGSVLSTEETNAADQSVEQAPAPEDTDATSAEAGDSVGSADTPSDDDAPASAAGQDGADADDVERAAAQETPSTDTTGGAEDAAGTDTAEVTAQASQSAPEATESSANGAPAEAPSGASAEPEEASESAAAQSPAASPDSETTASAGDTAAAVDETDAGRTSAPDPETEDAEEQAYEPPSATSSADRATAPAAAEGPDTLVVEVAGRSWIEVYDDQGQQLVYTLYTGNAPLRLRGTAPFNVFLGNSPDVRVRFDGETVTTSAFTRSDQTARFLVDADGARRR